MGWMDVGGWEWVWGGVLQSGIPWATLCSHLSHVWQALFHSELAATLPELDYLVVAR